MVSVAGSKTPTVSEPASRIKMSLLWLLLSSSSIVFLEPAPYELIALLMIGGMFVTGSRFPPGIGLPTFLLMLFVMANLLSMYNVLDVSQALLQFGITFYLILTWLLFATMVYEDPSRTINVIWHGYIIAALIATTLGFIGYLQLIPGSEAFAMGFRAKGAFKDPNVFGPFLVPPVLFLLAGMKGLRGGRWLVQSALALFLCSGILIGFSRGAWGNLIIAVAFFIGLRLATTRSAKDFRTLLFSTLLVGAIVATVLTVVIINTSVGEDFAERALLYQYYDRGPGGRWNTILAGLILGLESPFGIGPGHILFYLPWESHNVFVKSLLENGWLGFFGFIALLLVSFHRFFRLAIADTPAQQSAQVLCAALVGILANSMVIDSLHWRHFFLILGMGWGLVAAHPVVSLRSPQKRSGANRHQEVTSGTIASRMKAASGSPYTGV